MTISEFIRKMKGGAKCPPGVPASELLWSWLGAVIGIGICGYLSSAYFEPRDLTLLIGSFGASAVLVYGAIKSPLAQPRNLSAVTSSPDLSALPAGSCSGIPSGWLPPSVFPLLLLPCWPQRRFILPEEQQRSSQFRRTEVP